MSVPGVSEQYAVIFSVVVAAGRHLRDRSADLHCTRYRYVNRRCDSHRERDAMLLARRSRSEEHDARILAAERFLRNRERNANLLKVSRIEIELFGVDRGPPHQRVRLIADFSELVVPSWVQPKVDQR